MKRIVAALSIVVVCGAAHAGNQWTVKKNVDEMTDKVSCHLNSPTGSIDFSFQGGKLYIVSAKPLRGPTTGLLMVRVDKNPPIDLALRFVQWPYLAAVENFHGGLDSFLGELPQGSTLKYRGLAVDGLAEGSLSLAGFSEAWDKFESCRRS